MRARRIVDLFGVVWCAGFGISFLILGEIGAGLWALAAAGWAFVALLGTW